MFKLSVNSQNKKKNSSKFKIFFLKLLNFVSKNQLPKFKLFKNPTTKPQINNTSDIISKSFK